jgi:hypothetical protein
MTGLGTPVRSIVLATLAAALLSSGTPEAAEPIRVLLIIPSGSPTLTRQVSQFEDALRRSNKQVARAESLAEADAVVQITRYRRTTDPNGVPQHWWYGFYKLLAPPKQGTFTRAAEPFTLVVGDVEDWQVEPAVTLLGVTLARAMGLAPYSATRQSF